MNVHRVFALPQRSGETEAQRGAGSPGEPLPEEPRSFRTARTECSSHHKRRNLPAGRSVEDAAGGSGFRRTRFQRPAAGFPTIGKIFSNHWKMHGNFFQSLENAWKFFPIIGKREKIFPIIGKSGTTGAGGGRFRENGVGEGVKKSVARGGGCGMVQTTSEASVAQW